MATQALDFQFGTLPVEDYEPLVAEHAEQVSNMVAAVLPSLCAVLLCKDSSSKNCLMRISYISAACPLGSCGLACYQQ
jgi:hypothetical protein